MKTIWKAVLKPADLQEIEVPEGSDMLCAREQRGEICVWFRCDPGNLKEKRSIAIVGTGHPSPDGGQYLGTAALEGGDLMFHVFAQAGR